MSSNEVLLVGYGSIGKRHARNLLEMGIVPYVLTGHPDDANVRFIKSPDEPDHVDRCIIASPTASHYDDFVRCLRLRPSKILVEKPLCSSSEEGLKMKKMAKEAGVKVYVAYNLRFLGPFAAIRKFIGENRDAIKLVDVVAGQDLRDWRPATDYRKSYSARRARGGGVDLDLSHEIDYVLWLFGPGYKTRMMYRNKISRLEIDAPDVFKLLLDYGSLVVDLSLDYIRKRKERYIRIVCDDGQLLTYDLNAGRLEIDGRPEVEVDGISQSYKRMMRAFFSDDDSKLCTLDEGLDVLKVLEV